MKNSKFGDSVASEMESILSSETFKSIFSSAQKAEKIDLSSEFSSTYTPFVRTASDKTDKTEILKSVVSSLSEISEVLDNIGLEKSASAALYVLDGMIKEASDWSEDSVPRPGEAFNYDLNIFGDDVDEDFIKEVAVKFNAANKDTKKALFNLIEAYPDAEIPSDVPKFTSDKGFADDKTKEKADLDKMLEDVNKELKKIQEEGSSTRDVLKGEKDEHKADSCMVDDCKSCDEHSASFLEMEPKPPVPPTVPGGPIGLPPAEPLVTDPVVIEAYNKILKMIK